jgi:hypothetical protein
MKHLKTFQKFIKESEDFEGFLQALGTAVKAAGGYFYEDEEAGDFTFAISKKPLTPSQVETMFDSGKPAPGAKMFYFENTLEEIEKELTAAVKKMGLSLDLKGIYSTYM